MANHDALEFLVPPGSPKRLKELFTSFDRDPKALEDFISNPTGRALDEIFGETRQGVTPDAVSDANKFLISAMSNPGFKSWLADYQKKTVEEIEKPSNAGKAIYEIIPRTRFIEELSNGLISHGDVELVSSLLTATKISPSGSTVVTNDVAVAVAVVVAIVVVVTAIDATPRPTNPLYDMTANPQTFRTIAEALTNAGRADRKSR